LLLIKCSFTDKDKAPNKGGQPRKRTKSLQTLYQLHLHAPMAADTAKSPSPALQLLR
jgi:hypothetical protein